MNRVKETMPMIRSIRVLSLLFAFTLAAVQLPAQVATGTPPFGSFAGGPDVINLANLNAHWTFPILHKPGRGIDFVYDMGYDTSVWYPVTSGSTTSWQPLVGFGWRGSLDANFGYILMSRLSITQCPKPYQRNSAYNYNWYYYDSKGVSHYFGETTDTVEQPCGNITTTSLSNVQAIDGSGYTFSATGSTPGPLYSSGGQLIHVPRTIKPGAVGGGTATLTDRNGNQITTNSTGQFFDTLSSSVPVLTVGGSGTPSSPIKFTYTAPSGANASYQMNYTNYTVATNFGVSGITEYQYTAALPLVSSIVLPDGSQYSFTYEATPSTPTSGACTPYTGTTCTTARVTSITLPTGGTITYSYTGGNNGIFSDGSTAGLKRYTPDTGSTAYWNYARTPGTGGASTTTITDPTSSANQTVIQFYGIYETQRQVYQGSTSGTLLATTNTCYNGAASPCNSTAVYLPITQRSVITTLPGASNLMSKHVDSFNADGALTETDDHDYGIGVVGGLLRKILYTYASLGNITAFRQQVTVQDGSGHTASRTNYNYDETSVQATSSTPQHTSITGSRGNLTSVNYYTQGSTYLTSRATYYDTGNVLNTTDVNGGVTTYSYASGQSSCYNSFPTGITEAISTLTTSATWNCTGGVQTSATDENGQTTYNSYTKDYYYWRPESSTDPTNAITSYCYGLITNGACTINPNHAEAVLPIVSGTSAADALFTVDVLGRQLLTQVRQNPSVFTFDTAETDYDVAARPWITRMPFSAGAGQTNSSSPATATSYDALNRVLQVIDGGGGTVTYNYPQNDVYISVLSPSGENAKRRQLEYDALGRLTSVCEVTGGYTNGPAGTCAQNTSYTGYWTNYTYNALGNLVGVTQNAQATTAYRQTRSYTYDLMGRLTSETNPETANTAYTYTYDTDATCGTSSGDRVKRIDAVGNTTCYAYDKLHRLTSATYSGSYAANTPNKYFVYDAATINTSPTTTMQQAKSRLAEAYTATSVSGTKITDLGFSYTVRGELTNTFQSTQHQSANYYNQLAQTYWANGATNQLSGNIAGLPTFTYGVDPEGRPQTASASSGQNPVTQTTFNTSSQVTQVTLGSGDSDAFTFDPNTGRMTNYQFNVNSQSVTSALTWNSNATLQQLAITDPFNSADSQTCNYVYDDITRLSSANCGSVSGTYAYDAFGNLDKSGSFSFQALYTNATTGQNTNRYISIPGATVSYDANGNVLSDGSHTYTWDAEGRPVTIDTVGLTYDALGRMAEQNRSGAYTQIVYAPTGQKLALMSAATLQKAFIPLPGNAQAVYASSGLISYYRHPDWLGSSRFASTPTPPTTMYSDTAYAPFGEPYAQTGTTDLSFTGQNQDTVAGGLSGPYDFLAREYGPQGRWASPDPAGLAAVDPTNPQSWNRYGYVLNSPLNYVDPLGLWTPGNSGCYPVYASGWSTNPVTIVCPLSGGGGGVAPVGSELPLTDGGGGSTGTGNGTNAGVLSRLWHNAVCTAATTNVALSLLAGDGPNTTSVGGTWGVTVGDGLMGKDRNYTATLNGDSWANASITWTTGVERNGRAFGLGQAGGPVAGISNGTVANLNEPGQSTWTEIGPVTVNVNKPFGSGVSFAVGPGVGVQYVAQNGTTTNTLYQTNCLGTYVNAIVNMANMIF